MLCPLQTITFEHDYGTYEGIECQETTCAWWIVDIRKDPDVDNSGCALKKLAERMG